jgi:gliding motility-associated-like protein
MKKLILIFCFAVSNYISAQSIVSTTHCMDDYFFEVSTSFAMSDNTSIALGTFHPDTSIVGINVNMFMTKFDDKGNIVWSKKILFPFKVEKARAFPLSNNTFLLFLNPFDFSIPNNVPLVYCIDNNGVIQWKQQGNYNSKIIDFPTDKSFVLNFGYTFAKLKYDGTRVWEKELNINSPEGAESDAFAQYDNSNFLYAYGLGSDNSGTITKYKLDRIVLLKVNISKGDIVLQKKVISSQKDTLNIRTLSVVNGEIFMGGETGIYENSNLQTNDNYGFLAVLDKNLNFKKANRIMLKNKGLDLFVINAQSYNGNLLLNLEGGNYKKYYTEHIIAKYNISANMIDTSLYYNTTIPNGSFSEDVNQLHFDNKSNAFFNGTRLNGINFVKSSNAFYGLSCKPIDVPLMLKPFIIKVINHDSAVLYTVKNIVEPGVDVVINDLKFKSYNQCPECFCPSMLVEKDTICEGDYKLFLKNGKFEKYTKAGIYRDSTLNVNGCINFRELRLTVRPKATHNATYFLCTTTPSVTIANKIYTKEGVFVDTLKTKTGCDSILTINIKSLKDFNVSLGDDKEILEGENITLTASSNYASIVEKYTWLPVGTSTCDTCHRIDIKPIQSQSYIVKIDAKGCLAMDTINIKLSNKDFMFIPNAFSPNGDSKNDTFRPFTSDIVEKIELFTIYDRWGNQVHEIKNANPNDDDTAWNGTHRGQDCNPNIYTYIVHARLRNGAQKKFAGDLMLWR